MLSLKSADFVRAGACTTSQNVHFVLSSARTSLQIEASFEFPLQFSIPFHEHVNLTSPNKRVFSQHVVLDYI